MDIAIFFFSLNFWKLETKCTRNPFVHNEVLFWLRWLRKQIQITKSENPFGLKIKNFRPTHNPILLNIENIDPFLSFSIGDLKISQTYQTLLHL